MYNDRSVLENHHISEAFKVIRKDESNIVLNLSREEYRLVSASKHVISPI